MSRRGWLLVGALTALVAIGGVTPTAAVATDIEALRAEAQSLGARVSVLENDLAELNARAETLRTKMEGTSRKLGWLELQKHELDDQHDQALDRFVARAVRAYKDGPSARVEFILGAKTMSEMLTMAETQLRAADKDARSVTKLTAARTALEKQQASIDSRQIELAADAASIDAIAEDLAATVAERRAILDEVVAKVEALEEQARITAAASSDPDATFLDLLTPTGPAPDIPSGYAGTGVTFEGVASWYGPGFEGNSTASGDIFDPALFTAASRDLPFGTWLFVRHGSRGVVVLVNDRGPFIEGRVLDLSQGAAESLGITGLGWIEAEIILET